NYLLTGPYVTIVDAAPPSDAPPASSDGNFLFDRSRPDFEAVNVYYHIHRYRKYIDSLGFSDICDLPVKADARGSFGDNSFFVEDASGGLLQFGVGGVDDGEDADVILHEYAHALSACAAPASNEGFERRAADEGFGDYVAASASFDFSPYRWSDIFTWDGHNEFWSGRSLAEERTWPQVLTQSPNSIYAAGAVWAATLMRARMQMSKRDADRVVVQAQFYNARNMSMRSAAKAVLTADSVLNAGKGRKIFLEAFCTAQILTGEDCSPLARQDGARGVRVYPLPVEDGFVVEMPTETGKLTLYNAAGKIVRFDSRYRNQTRVEVGDMPAGMYVLGVEDSLGTVRRLKLPVVR
ncbi:MAG: T9SS type A sorting domain-containing protein, partial [Bacteroidia bacterium]|nr:T9SS type A sorting domain-containing protein [Bacteroidia bacterium]